MDRSSDLLARLRRGHEQSPRTLARPRIRPSAAALGLACTAASLMMGCGGGQSTGHTSAGPSGLSGPSVAVAHSRSSPSLAAVHPTKARALAFARAVNLTAGDVPEARIKKRRGHSSKSWEGRDFQRCIGASVHAHELADVKSPLYLRGQELEIEEIGSDVTVNTSAGAATHIQQALSRPAVRHCLARLVTQELGHMALPNANWGPAAIYGLPVHVAGASGEVGLRIALTATSRSNEITMPTYIDVLAFARGPAEITLMAISWTQPVPADVERQLLSTLAARASSHRL